MNIYELIIISIGLAMDAFAVSICKGLSMRKMNWKNGFIIAWYFALFQAIMPFIGYVLGTSFYNLVSRFDHWIAFILLTLIGSNMIKESFSKDLDIKDDSVSFSTMIVLAIATSIDAFAVGITFAIFNVNIITAIIFIGFITFFVSLLGVKIGNSFGDKYEKKAEFMGGFILIVLGLKILFEHLNIF